MLFHLYHLVTWVDKWQMRFNVDKCKILHDGSNNYHNYYAMNGSELVKDTEEIDLVVRITSYFKSSKRSSEVVKTANKLVEFIGKTFEFKSEREILTLFNALLRRHFEYCV